MREKRDSWTVFAYLLIGAGAAIYGAGALGAVLAGVAIAGPFSLLALGVLGLLAIGVGILLVKVILDRARDPEDRHYSKNIYD